MNSSPSAKSDNNGESIRQERREEKLRKKKERMKMHGKSLGKIYENVVRKRGRGS